MASESGKGTGNGDVPVRLHYFELTFCCRPHKETELLFPDRPIGPQPQQPILMTAAIELNYQSMAKAQGSAGHPEKAATAQSN